MASDYIDKVKEEIRTLAGPVLTDNGLELVDVEYRQEQVGWVLRLLIYKEEGVTISDCTSVSREMSHLLDVEDLIPQKYTLEVSSPGLDRPLRSERDFIRNKDKKIKLVVRSDGSSLTVEGLINDVKDGMLLLSQDGEIITYSLDEIKKAKLIIEF